jgi:NADP-dependent 3-hydroxy acid dehydrogenase YdfG
MVQTEFSEVRFKGDTDRAEKVYQGFMFLQLRKISPTSFTLWYRESYHNIADLWVLHGSFFYDYKKN